MNDIQRHLTIINFFSTYKDLIKRKINIKYTDDELLLNLLINFKIKNRYEFNKFQEYVMNDLYYPIGKSYKYFKYNKNSKQYRRTKNFFPRKYNITIIKFFSINKDLIKRKINIKYINDESLLNLLINFKIKNRNEFYKFHYCLMNNSDYSLDKLDKYFKYKIISIQKKLFINTTKQLKDQDYDSEITNIEFEIKQLIDSKDNERLLLYKLIQIKDRLYDFLKVVIYNHKFKNIVKNISMINKKIESISKNYKKYKINKNLKNDLTLAVAQRQSNLIRINYGLDLTANEYYSAVRESELLEQIEWQKIKDECPIYKEAKEDFERIISNMDYEISSKEEIKCEDTKFNTISKIEEYISSDDEYVYSDDMSDE